MISDQVNRYLDNDFIVSVQCFFSADVRARIPNIDSNERLEIKKIKWFNRLNDLKNILCVNLVIQSKIVGTLCMR